MPVTSRLYGKLYQSVFNKEVDYDTDVIRAILLTSTYTPNYDTHRYKSDLTNEVSGTGYTAGGAALTTKTVTYTAANSWGTSRANSTAYALGDVVRPASGNGYLYKAVAAGTSGGTIPTYPTVPGQTVADGTVTWVNAGTAICVFDADDPTWASSTITARYLAFYEDTGTGTTSALISLVDFGADVSSTNAAFTYQVPALGIAHFFSA